MFQQTLSFSNLFVLVIINHLQICTFGMFLTGAYSYDCWGHHSYLLCAICWIYKSNCSSCMALMDCSRHIWNSSEGVSQSWMAWLSMKGMDLSNCSIHTKKIFNLTFRFPLSLQVVMYVVSRPGRELLFTVVTQDEKYKAKVMRHSFIHSFLQ